MDWSTCSAVGMVPDALLETVEAAMAWRRAGPGTVLYLYSTFQVSHRKN